MRRFRALLLRLRAIIRKGDHEFDEELGAHLQLHAEDNLRAGMTPDEARREALLKLGGVASTTDSYRAAAGFPMLDATARDLRYALRTFRTEPTFAITAVASLALGIGAATALFSLVYGVLMNPFPYTEAD